MSENKYLRAMQQAKEHVNAPGETGQMKPPRSGTTRTGRPPGKRSNPNWEQITLFIRKDTKQAALRRLLDEDTGQDLSEVIDQLLAKWAKIL